MPRQNLPNGPLLTNGDSQHQVSPLDGRLGLDLVQLAPEGIDLDLSRAVGAAQRPLKLALEAREPDRFVEAHAERLILLQRLRRNGANKPEHVPEGVAVQVLTPNP